MGRITLFFVAAGLLFVAATRATAAVSIYLSPKVGDSVYFDGAAGWDNTIYYYEGSGYYGGPFIGTLDNSAKWTTFCVEADGGDEHMVLDTTYTVSSLDPHVAIATRNYVTDEAKWLYWQYGNGLLPTTLAGGESWTVNDVQVAIWHGVQTHGEGGAPLDMNLAPGGSAFTLAPQDLFGLATAALTGPDKALAEAEANEVYVLNPVDGGTQVQSMLYAIPEPATLVVWGLLGVSWLGMRVWQQGRRDRRQPWSNEDRAAILEIIRKR